MKIGFIGLGNMGKPMALNLMNSGHDISGFDTVAVDGQGLRILESATDVAKDADVVITMLPNGAILRNVAEVVLPAMASDAVFLDCSTVDVDSARYVAKMATEANVIPLDAPVSGGIGGASAGTLTFMVGGSKSGFEKVKPLFDVMGQKAVLCGPSGNGQAAKICNNMILAISMLGVAEAFTMGRNLGVDPQILFDITSTSSGQCWAINAYCPVPGPVPTSPANRDFQPGFTADMMLKDLRLSQDAARSSATQTVMGGKAEELFASFVDGGNGALDFSAIIRMVEGAEKD